MVLLDRWLEPAVAGLRIAVGIIFLWAGLEKLLGPEPFSAAGFLQFGTSGTLGWPFVTVRRQRERSTTRRTTCGSRCPATSQPCR